MSAVAGTQRWSAIRERDQRRSKHGGPEPIEMIERRHGYFPQVFKWRGCQYDVHAVERCWTVSRRRLMRTRVERHCFRVRCADKVFDVCQDIQHGTWHLLRSELA